MSQSFPVTPDLDAPDFVIPDFTGWTLEEARAALAESATAIEIRVVETAPPLRPARLENARTTRKAKPNQEKREGRPLPVWGQWRVLRCTMNASASPRSIELLVAREELAPPESPSPAAQIQLQTSS